MSLRVQVRQDLFTVFTTRFAASAKSTYSGEFPSYGAATYFDTCIGHYHHSYVEAENRILDVSENKVTIVDIPVPLSGYEITKADVVSMSKLLRQCTCSKRGRHA